MFEHNANLIPWRETGAKVETVPLTYDGDFDYEFLEQLLIKYKDYNSLKVGTFSAGSNITGNLIDVDRIAILCHKYSTLACFDYSAVAPYIDISMNRMT